MRPLRSWQGSWFPTRPRFKCTRLKTKSLVWFWHKAEDFPHRSDSFRFLRSFCRAYEAVGMPRARAATNKVRPASRVHRCALRFSGASLTTATRPCSRTSRDGAPGRVWLS